MSRRAEEAKKHVIECMDILDRNFTIKNNEDLSSFGKALAEAGGKTPPATDEATPATVAALKKLQSTKNDMVQVGAMIKEAAKTIGPFDLDQAIEKIEDLSSFGKALAEATDEATPATVAQIQASDTIQDAAKIVQRVIGELRKAELDFLQQARG